MSDSVVIDSAGEELIKFEIRYEGLDAERHQIDMMSLGESLQGFGRIYSVIGHYAATGQYAKQAQALSVKTYAQEAEAKCFSIIGYISTAAQAGMFEGSVGALIGAIVTYALGKRNDKSEEMRHLRELLEQQMGHNQKNLDRAMDTIERLTSGLGPSIKKSLSPVGESCSRIDLYANDSKHKSIDLADKEAILSTEDGELLEEREYTVMLTEFDKLYRRCKVHLLGDDAATDSDEGGLPPRINAEITDPAIQFTNNKYSAAVGSDKPIKVKAKALLKDGEITKLFISDCE
ncbi:DUF7946 domain-containing protein [Vreelandella titanicae]|uniref:DUF7946 domain-containing protein n=1 Tax=Vreelandella titanicae TaxID=664683 RepID=UPI00382D6636